MSMQCMIFGGLKCVIEYARILCMLGSISAANSAISVWVLLLVLGV